MPVDGSETIFCLAENSAGGVLTARDGGLLTDGGRVTRPSVAPAADLLPGGKNTFRDIDYYDQLQTIRMRRHLLITLKASYFGTNYLISDYHHSSFEEFIW